MKYDAEKPEGSGDNNLYLRWSNGDSIELILRGNPFVYNQHWDNKTKKSLICEGEGCPHCASDDENLAKKRFRFKTNAAVKDGDTWHPRIMEQSYAVYGQIQQLIHDGWDLSKNLIKITREGEKMETKYFVNAIPKQASPGDIEQLEALKLFDMEPQKKEDEGVKANPNFTSDDIPF